MCHLGSEYQKKDTRPKEIKDLDREVYLERKVSSDRDVIIITIPKKVIETLAVLYYGSASEAINVIMESVKNEVIRQYEKG